MNFLNLFARHQTVGFSIPVLAVDMQEVINSLPENEVTEFHEWSQGITNKFEGIKPLSHKILLPEEILEREEFKDATLYVCGSFTRPSKETCGFVPVMGFNTEYTHAGYVRPYLVNCSQFTNNYLKSKIEKGKKVFVIYGRA